jgi:hypothetical protein
LQVRKTSSDRSGNEAEVETFAGTVPLSNGKYGLEDLSGKRSYYLDNAKTAKKFEGKMALVTVILDTSTGTIPVQRIEVAAPSRKNKVLRSRNPSSQNPVLLFY